MDDLVDVVTSTAAGQAKLTEWDIQQTTASHIILRPSYTVDEQEDDGETFISVEVTFSPERRGAAKAAMLALVERAFAEVDA